MCFTDSDIQFAPQAPLLAGLITSLGFGHVSAGILLLHPEVFCRSISKEERETYKERAQKRQRQGEYRWEEIKMGNSLAFQRVQHRRFRAKDGTKAQSEEESAMLLSETSTLKNGIFIP
jgi:fatty acid synthase, bacteria type